jgi:hypothetical protein
VGCGSHFQALVIVIHEVSSFLFQKTVAKISFSPTADFSHDANEKHLQTLVLISFDNRDKFQKNQNDGW